MTRNRMDIPVVATVADDSGPFLAAIACGLPQPLLLWGHPEVGQTALVEEAAAAAGLPCRTLPAEELEAWDGFKDLSDSGQFRERSLESFLARGERADPDTFALKPGTVLYLRDLNTIPARLEQAIFDQVLNDRKLLNNPLPDDVRLVATALPPDRASALELLGPGLREGWEESRHPPALLYPTFTPPPVVMEQCQHWAVLPSVGRFLAWGRRQRLAAEVLCFLEEANAADPGRATNLLHAHLVRKPDGLHHLPSPRAFADLGNLLSERQPCFAGRLVKDAVHRAATAEQFLAWLHDHVLAFDPDRWIAADTSLTLHGDSVSGNQWLRHMRERIARGELRLTIDMLPTYIAYERRSIDLWATQELGDELGAELSRASSVAAADLARLQP
jgi:hypothetical protein